MDGEQKYPGWVRLLVLAGGTAVLWAVVGGLGYGVWEIVK